MSRCKYYSCFHRKPKCNNPEKPSFFDGDYWSTYCNPCELCKERCGGIYPSEVPHADQTGWVQEIVDSKTGEKII